MYSLVFKSSIFIIVSILLSAFILNAQDNIDSKCYVSTYQEPNGDNSDSLKSSNQPAIKKIKLRKITNDESFHLNNNIDRFIFESEISDNSYSTMGDYSDVSPTNIHIIELGKPVFIKSKEQVIKKMPVLDQGNSNTCAYFSSTAAFDILFGNGTDKYSNYMSLCLGEALSKNIIPIPKDISQILKTANTKSLPSPWDASEGIVVLSQFKSFGVVANKDENSQNGRFGFNEKKEPITLSQINEFKKISSFEYSLLFQSVLCNIKKVYKTESDFVNAIKKEINKGNIVSIGLIIASDYEPSNSGMTGSTKVINGSSILDTSKQQIKTNYNTWCSDPDLGIYIKNNSNNREVIGSHQMIIIGFIDSTNGKDGVFIVRNSWGKNSGDQGNNYITYKYAYCFCDELLSIFSK